MKKSIAIAHLAANKEAARQVAAAPEPDFDGETYDPALDRHRMTTQLGRVFERLTDGRWYHLETLMAFAQGSESGISARIRDLRKAKFGGWIVQRVRDPDESPKSGLWIYRLRNP